jgi:hypothetical protein
MDMENTKEVVEILASYFNNIIYVDDDFLVNNQEQTNNSENNGRSTTSKDKYVNSCKSGEEVKEQDDDCECDDDNSDDEYEVNDDDDDDDDGSDDDIDTDEQINETKKEIAAADTCDNMDRIYTNVGKMLDYFRNSDISVFPYIYIPKNETNLDRVLNYIRKSNFAIIDWELEHGRPQKTLEILSYLKDEGTLRFIVIYTNRPDLNVIKQAIEEKFKYDCSVIDAKNRILKIKSTCVMIAGKDKGNNIKVIIEKFCQALINQYGYFFISFFNIAEQIRSQTNNVLTDFMNPFEALLTVQLKSTGLEEQDYEENLKEIILSHLSGNVSINSSIMKNIVDNYKNKIKLLKEKDFQKIKENFKNWIIGKDIYENNKTVLTELNKSITKEHFDDILDAFISENIFLDSSEKRCKNFNEKLGVIKGKLNVSKESKKFLDTHLESFILAGIFEEPVKIESYASNLFKLMKLTSYRDTDLNNVSEMLLRAIPITEDNETETRNIFKTGDILISKDGNAFLLCITPPCDVFRPYKTDYNIKFLIGKKQDQYIGKLYNHLTILPLDDKMVQVEWCFYNEKYINLNDENDIESLKNYYKPYRMQKHYLQQIVSEYFAFWNRSGVDEIFIKEDKHFLGKSLNEIIVNSI